MKEKEIVIGSIVQVLYPNSRFKDKQGFVFEINEDGNEDGPIGVRFPHWYKYLFEFGQNKDATVRFQRCDLRVLPCFDPLPISEFIQNLFGEMGVWAICEHKIPLLPGQTRCEAKDCKGKAYFEIWINCWGTATSHHVCGKHTECHGNCMDTPPDYLCKQ